MRKCKNRAKPSLLCGLSFVLVAMAFLSVEICAWAQNDSDGQKDILAKMQLRRAFEKLDTNDDGKVTISEIPKAQRKRYQQRDSNGDGVLTAKEMNAGLGAKSSSGAATAPLGPSVIKGQPAGIEVGKYAPDFTLEPIKIYPEFKKWLGDKAPKSFEDKIMLSDLVGKREVMLLFGSYT